MADHLTENLKAKQTHRCESIWLTVFTILGKIIVFLWEKSMKVASWTYSTVSNYYHPEEHRILHPQFNERKYEPIVENLGLAQEHLGFTNQVLCQESKKAVTFYLPVYITNKIKSIQDVSIQSLTGDVSCALIINIFYGDIPERVVQHLETSILVQLNRGEAIKLQDDGVSITTKNDRKSKFLIFTLRKVFLAFLVEDTVWSPFELIELVISLTLNTVTIPKTPAQLEQSTGLQKQYKVSFNCMRNSDVIPMSYALDCVFGVYDLAERRLEAYHSAISTYSELRRNHEERKEAEKEKKTAKKEEKKPEKKEKHVEVEKNSSPKKMTSEQSSILKSITRNVGKYAVSLSMRSGGKQAKKPPKKVKYFQYTHFVIPLYKYPGNSLATIFIPVFLLALVSLAIFFQQPELSARIGAIATMVLGYIALIPSIKEQLPPSSKMTVIETVVYIQTVCCLLCLFQSFRIRNYAENEYIFIWQENPAFLICLSIHIMTFLFIIGLYAFHKLIWEPGYNSEDKVVEIKPADNIEAWDNPYCDLAFIKFNEDIEKNTKMKPEEKQAQKVRPYGHLGKEPVMPAFPLLSSSGSGIDMLKSITQSMKSNKEQERANILSEKMLASQKVIVEQEDLFNDFLKDVEINEEEQKEIESKKEEPRKEVEKEKEESPKEENLKDEVPREEYQKEEHQKQQYPKEIQFKKEDPKEEISKEVDLKEASPKVEDPKQDPRKEDLKEECPKEVYLKEEHPREEDRKDANPKQENLRKEDKEEKSPKQEVKEETPKKAQIKEADLKQEDINKETPNVSELSLKKIDSKEEETFELPTSKMYYKPKTRKRD